MAKIVIDARESGTSTGRYVERLISICYNTRYNKPSFSSLLLSYSSQFVIR